MPLPRRYIVRPEDWQYARAKLGLTQEQMADALGLFRRQTVSDYEQGVRKAGRSVSLLAQAYLEGYRPEKGWPGKEEKAE